MESPHERDRVLCPHRLVYTALAMDAETVLAALPDSPGVYLFKNAQDEVLYVGKACSIVKRVRSHLARRPPADFVPLAQHVDFVVTANEVEALLLEYNLIHQYQPRYNIRLKDDKKYPWIKVTWQETWPRVFLTRTVRRDGARYFGPFPNVRPAREALQMIRAVFPVRSCRIPSAQLKLDRACIDYEMKRCVAPCIGAVSEEDYRALFAGIESVLRGRIEPVKRDLRRRMQAAAEAHAYERAAFYRDTIANLEQLQARQSITRQHGRDVDTIGYGRFQDVVSCVVLRRRGGRVIGSETYFLDQSAQASVAEALAAFVLQLYSITSHLPQEIDCPQWPEEHDVLAQWLTERAGQPVVFNVPQRGERRQSVDMAVQNAVVQASNRYRRLHGIAGTLAEGLSDLTEALGLDKPPLRMECYDVSNLQGQYTVASMVVFWCGRPQRSAFRRFRIRTVTGPDDYASLREVLRRRFTRDDERFAQEPDLVVIDGGLGQLHAVAEVLSELGRAALPLISLAKQEEIIYRSGTSMPLVLPQRHPGLQLLCRLRDEAHRFAVQYHRALRSKGLRVSALDGIAGLGPRRKQRLLAEFGSVKAIGQAGVEQLVAVRGISRTLAERIIAHLQQRT